MLIMDLLGTHAQLDEQERDVARILEEFGRKEYEESTDNTEDDFEDEVMQPIDWDTRTNRYKGKQYFKDIGVDISDGEEDMNNNGQHSKSSSSLSPVPASSPSNNSPIQGKTRSSRRKSDPSKPKQRDDISGDKNSLSLSERLVDIIKILKTQMDCRKSCLGIS
jgi:hypothetical protein